MNAQPFTGKLVRLATIDLEKDIERWARWNRDSEYQQLLDWGPSKLYTPKEMREWVEKESGSMFNFFIHTLEDDEVIGFLDLGGMDWTSGNCWLGVGIGERAYWGKGYGTDAINVLLRFAFEELNLKRVSLNVFEYNERAIRSYEKIGFQHEGRQRKLLNRFDQRWDMVFMGILRGEWEEKNPAYVTNVEQPGEKQAVTVTNVPLSAEG